MARGKHAARKRNRDAHQLAQQVHAARAELAAEQEQLRQAESEAAQVTMLEQRLSQARRERDAIAADEEVRLRREVAVLTTVLREATAFDERIHREWNRTTAVVTGLLGGGLDGFENLMQLAFTGGHILDGTASMHRIGGLGAQRVQKAQGRRRRITASGDDTPTRHLDAAMRRRHYYALHDLLGTDGTLPDTATEQDKLRLAELDRRMDHLDRVGANDVDADAVHGWHPMLWLRDLPYGGHHIMDLLGATQPATQDMQTTDSPEPAPEPTADMPAARRAALATGNPEQLIDAWRQPLHRSALITAASARVPTPWAELPRYPRPGDAVSIKHWYTLAALGHWSRLHDTATDGTIDPDDDDAALLPAVRAELTAAGNIAVGIAAATPFWLPPGQTAAYADSEPLSDADREDIRLPFPQVLLALADPLHLPPQRDLPADHARDHALNELDNAVLAQRRGTDGYDAYARVMMQVVDTTVWDNLPHLADAIAARGAIVEAILLLGDTLGKPDDLFGWCLAVPAATGGLLGRWVVPARRSRTTYTDHIMNLTAVAAWADWHSPDRELDLPPNLSTQQLRNLLSSSEFRNLEQRGGAGAVRVLDVKRTTGDNAASNDAPHRTVAPHVRRGHWRRQHHGPARQLVKRVRIAPVLVNAGRSHIAPRVYRLPHPPPEHNTQ